MLNKVSNTVLFIHISTGMVVSCQTEISQMINEKISTKMLKILFIKKEIEKKKLWKYKSSKGYWMGKSN